MKKILLILIVPVWLLTPDAKANGIIRAVLVNGRIYDFGKDTIILRSSQTLTILFSDHSVEKNYYARLVNYDTIFNGFTEPVVVYSGLNKGNYTFQGALEPMPAPEYMAQLTIVVEGSLLGEWGFLPLLLLYLLLIFGGAGYFIILSNFRSKEKLVELRNEWTNKLHTDIGGDLSSVSLRLDTLKRRLDPLEPQIKESVVKTYDILKEIQKKLRFVFDLIDPKKDSLHVMLADVADFATANFAIRNVFFEYRNELNPEANYTIDIGRINKLYLVMKEVINNCFKHAQAGKVSMQVFHNKKGLYIKIQDDGIGFDPAAQHQGNGIANLLAYAREGLMDMDIDSAPGRGTTISIFAPNL